MAMTKSRAQKITQALFGTDSRADEATLLDVMSDAPSTEKSLLGSYALIDALVDSGLCRSKGAARKDIAAGGVYVNNDRVSDVAATIKSST
jgi:tyrosyl-tRNA synthetase